jgi:hypothetical protein
MEGAARHDAAQGWCCAKRAASMHEEDRNAAKSPQTIERWWFR